MWHLIVLIVLHALLGLILLNGDICIIYHLQSQGHSQRVDYFTVQHAHDLHLDAGDIILTHSRKYTIYIFKHGCSEVSHAQRSKGIHVNINRLE